MYRTWVSGGRDAMLRIKDVRDYAIVLLNGRPVGVLDRRLKQDSLSLQLPAGRVRLDILVENLGRIDFGPYLLKNKKGITDKVELGGVELKGWEMYSLPFKTIAGSKTLAGKDFGPVIRRGSFDMPVEWLKPAGNEVVVLELLKTEVRELRGVERPVLGEVRK